MQKTLTPPSENKEQGFPVNHTGRPPDRARHEEPTSSSALHSHRHRSRLSLGCEGTPSLVFCCSQWQSKQAKSSTAEHVGENNSHCPVVNKHGAGGARKPNRGLTYTPFHKLCPEKVLQFSAGSSQEMGSTSAAHSSPQTVLLGQALTGTVPVGSRTSAVPWPKQHPSQGTALLSIRSLGHKKWRAPGGLDVLSG